LVINGSSPEHILNRSFFVLLGVISGDSLVLRGRPGPQGQPPKERWVRQSQMVHKAHQCCRILYLADVSSPRLGNASREDEVSFLLYRVCLPYHCHFASHGHMRHAISYAPSPWARKSHLRPHINFLPERETYPVILAMAKSTVLTLRTNC
jgi:hypothetical protein